MIESVIQGSIVGVMGADFICNPANGKGPMGKNAAGAIRQAGGKVIQDEAFMVCRSKSPRPGELYRTGAGSLPYEGVVHLVTMAKPGGATTPEIIEKCLRSLVSLAEEYPDKIFALPALGTGVGRLPKVGVASRFARILQNSTGRFIVVDIDKEFIAALNHVLATEKL